MAGIVSIQQNRPITVNQQTVTGSALDAAPGGGQASRVAYWTDADTLDDAEHLFVDAAEDALGIQTTDPQAALHVASVTGSGIDDVTSGSASLVSETLPATPTGTASVITVPAAGSGGGVSFVDQGSGGFYGDGTTYYFRIYPCLYVAGTGSYYRSTAYEEVSGAIPNDADYYNASVSWGSVSIPGETVAYFVEGSTDGSSFSPIGAYLTTGEIISSLSGSDPTTPWPTFYKAESGPTAFSGGSAQATNVGMGGISEAGVTVLMEVDSLKDIGGTLYASGSPTSGSFDDTGLTNYDAEISWTDNGNASNGVARISQDSGSTWYYAFTGSTSGPFTFSSLSNDPDAEARWNQTYPGTSTYTFTPHGLGSSPSGNAVYSAAGSDYSANVSDTYGVIIRHDLSGNLSGKIIAPASAPAYGQQYASGLFYDVGYTTWASGATVTPQSYGFSGTEQNRAYRIYSYSPVLGIYGDTPLALSTSASGGSRYVTLSWTLPAGITQVRITRSVNGGAYSSGKLVTGSSLVDDALQTWGDGTTVTPTAVVPGAIRADRASGGSATAQPALEIVDTQGSGVRYPTLAFGVAASSSAAASYQAFIQANSSTGYLTAVTGRMEIAPSRGGTPTAMFGNANIVNNGSSSSVHFQVNGQNGHLFATRSDQDTVGFGQAIGSDQQCTVQVQPARSGDAAIVLIGHSLMSDSSTLLRFQTSAGTYNAEMTVGGWLRASTGAAANPSLSCRSDTNTGFHFPAADTIGVATGGTQREGITGTGHFFGGTTTPTARVHIAAGSTSASTAPIKLTSGSLMTTPEVGAVEFLTDRLYYTRTTSTTRLNILASTAVPTAGRVWYSDGSGFQLDNANFTYSGNRLSPTYITLGAGATAANSGPLKFTSGSLMTTAEAGAVEFLTDKWYATITTGASRKEFTLNDAALTSGTFPVATTNGRLTDSGFTTTNLVSGTYTPTLTGVANVASSTSRQATYVRVGNTVTVAGQIDVTPTANNTETKIGISLPVPASFTTAYQLGGVGHTTPNVSAGHGAAIQADATNDRAEMNYYETHGTTDTICYTFTYQVL